LTERQRPGSLQYVCYQVQSAVVSNKEIKQRAVVR